MRNPSYIQIESGREDDGEREREMSMHMYVYKKLYRCNRENAQRNLAR